MQQKEARREFRIDSRNSRLAPLLAAASCSDAESGAVIVHGEWAGGHTLGLGTAALRRRGLAGVDAVEQDPRSPPRQHGERNTAEDGCQRVDWPRITGEQ